MEEVIRKNLSIFTVATFLTAVALLLLPAVASAQSFSIPSAKGNALAIADQVSGPEQLDAALMDRGLDPRLINFHFASTVDLTPLGLDRYTHLPVMISEREGARESLYFLEPGETVLAGLYVNDREVALRYVTRVTGSGIPAVDGDLYRERLENLRGETVVTFQGTLEVKDFSRGMGQMVLRPVGPDMGDRGDGPMRETMALELETEDQGCVWIAWSFYMECDDDDEEDETDTLE